MKISTVLLGMLPCEILIVLAFILPENYIDYVLAIFMFYMAVVFFILGKYILRGDNAHLISGVNISYEEAKLSENIERYAKKSKQAGRILQVTSAILLIVGAYILLSRFK